MLNQMNSIKDNDNNNDDDNQKLIKLLLIQTKWYSTAIL